VPGTQLSQVQKKQKKDKGRNREKLVECVAPNGPMLPTGQSGARSAKLDALGFFRLHRLKSTGQSTRGSEHSCALVVQRLAPRRPRANGHMAHRIVRCPPEVETSKSGNSLSRPVRVMFTVWCAQDSPVRQRTEGNNGLPNGAPTVSSCLGAIKGTHRCMEQYTKPPLNILQRLDSASTHTIHCI
jgi:hypothetical protein